jgi:hypothetical protein
MMNQKKNFVELLDSHAFVVDELQLVMGSHCQSVELDAHDGVYDGVYDGDGDDEDDPLKKLDKKKKIISY